MPAQQWDANDVTGTASSRFWNTLPVGAFSWLTLGMPYFLECEMFFFPHLDWPELLWVVQSPYWGFLLVCVVAALFFRRPARGDSRFLAALDIVSGGAVLAAVLLVQVRVLGSSPWLVLAGQSLCGAAVAWQYIRWGQCLVHIDLRQAVSCICCSFMVVGILKCALRGLPDIRAIVDSVLSVVAVVGLRRCLVVSGALPQRGMMISRETFRMRDVWLIPVAVVLLSGAVGLMYAARYNTFGSSDGLQMLLGNGLEVLAATVVWLWVCVRKRSLDIVGIVAVMTVVVATSCVLLATLGGRAESSAFFLTSIDYELLNLFVWVLLAALSAKVPGDVRLVFAVGWMLRSAPALVGEFVAKMNHVELGPIVCSVLMYVACVVLVAVIFGRNVSTAAIFNCLAAEAPADKTNLARRCRELTDAYRLTSREAEVLELLAGGRTRPYIAESLGISENTVRVYTAKIYSKLEIHDRGSLFMLVYGSSESALTG